VYSLWLAGKAKVVGPLLVALILTTIPAWPFEVEDGAGTYYKGSYGNLLYCGGYYYTTNEPWVALDSSWYESGKVRCAQKVWVYLKGAEPFGAWAMDAGYLNRHYIKDLGPEERIIVDVPDHLWPLHPSSSAPVRVVWRSNGLRNLCNRCVIGYPNPDGLRRASQQERR
jgi:hypothetical protein